MWIIPDICGRIFPAVTPGPDQPNVLAEPDSSSHALGRVREDDERRLHPNSKGTGAQYMRYISLVLIMQIK